MSTRRTGNVVGKPKASSKVSKKTSSEGFYGLEDMEKDFGPMTFGKALWALRKSDEVSQVDLARELGISRQNLCDLEKGRKIPSPERAFNIGEALGYGGAYFVRLALQDQLRESGLDLKVTVEPRAKKRKRA